MTRSLRPGNFVKEHIVVFSRVRSLALAAPYVAVLAYRCRCDQALRNAMLLRCLGDRILCNPLNVEGRKGAEYGAREHVQR